MTVLDRSAILSASDMKIEELEIPEWGGSVHIKSLSGKDRDAFESSMFEGRGKNRKENFANLRARLLVRTIVTESGDRIFQNNDINALGNKNAKALDRCFAKARELSGMSDEDVEEMVKNSEEAQDDSTSD